MVLAPGKDLESRVASVRVVEGRRIYALDGQEYRERELLGNTRNSHTFVVESPEGMEVLKVLNYRRFPGQSVDEKRKAVELFEREMAVLARLDHPQIPKIKNYFTTNLAGETAFYFTQEYFSGSTVETLIKEQGKLTLEEALPITRSLLEPLDYCHQHNIYHRDIKPANIIWDGHQAKLVDFGAVMEEKVSTLGGSTMIGTLGYAAPEQLWGKASAVSDIYGAGATLLHMLTGIHPETMHDQQANDFNERFRLQFAEQVRSLDGHVQTILSKCLDFDERKRYQSVGKLREALESKADSSAVTIMKSPEVSPTYSNRDLYLEIRDVTLKSIALGGALILAPSIIPTVLRIGSFMGVPIALTMGFLEMNVFHNYLPEYIPYLPYLFIGLNSLSLSYEAGRLVYQTARERVIEKNKKKLLTP